MPVHTTWIFTYIYTDIHKHTKKPGSAAASIPAPAHEREPACGFHDFKPAPVKQHIGQHCVTAAAIFTHLTPVAYITAIMDGNSRDPSGTTTYSAPKAATNTICCTATTRAAVADITVYAVRGVPIRAAIAVSWAVAAATSTDRLAPANFITVAVHVHISTNGTCHLFFDDASAIYFFKLASFGRNECAESVRVHV
jgi:hypothetical protein